MMHIIFTAPPESGEGAASAIESALKTMSNLIPKIVDYN